MRFLGSTIVGFQTAMDCRNFFDTVERTLRADVNRAQGVITYDGRGYDEGKKITWRDGVVALWVLVKYRFTE